MKHALRHALLSTAITAAGLLGAAPAHASDEFPDAVRNRWGVDQLPVSGDGCRLCHTNDDGGKENVRQSFGRLIREYYHVKKGNTGELQDALDDIEVKRWDSDRDGVSDFDEVALDATNPNDPEDRRPPDMGSGGEGGSGEVTALPPPAPEFVELPPAIEHGCSLAPTRASRSGIGLALLALVLTLFKRRSARPL